MYPYFFIKATFLRTDVHLQKTLLRTIFSFFQTPAVHFLYAQSNTPEDGHQHKIFYLCRAIQRGTCHLPCLHFSRTMERRIEEENLSGYQKPTTFCKFIGRWNVAIIDDFLGVISNRVLFHINNIIDTTSYKHTKDYQSNNRYDFGSFS